MKIVIAYNEKRDDSEAHAEFDTREAMLGIANLVEQLGHRAMLVDVTGPIELCIARLRQLAPDLIFNFAEGERGAFREAFYPALYEQLGIPHTGSSASCLAICLDKILTKRIVAAAGVRVPRVATSPPAVVKPNFEGSSKGLRLVRDPDELIGIPTANLVEEFVDGIDVAVAWFAGIGQLPAFAYRYDGEIYDYALKHVTPERVRIELLPDHPKLRDAATRAFDALGIAGYGRADFRLTPDGDVVFIEMNPLPSLTLAAGHDELYVAAATLGYTPRDLIANIVNPIE